MTRSKVLLQDGYFVHFFAPENIEPLPEHIVFILDTSGSMYGTKLKQLKDAMTSILSELKENDMFHIVEFNTFIYVWDIETGNRIKIEISNDDNPFEDVQNAELPPAVFATKDNVAKGKAAIAKLKDEGITNMLASLVTGLHLAKSISKEQKEKTKNNQPVVIFLTDGDPTSGIINTDQITNITTNYNAKEHTVPIFSLSFGDGADKYFLRKLSLKNLGFSRHIYEAADSSLQLQNFYKEISSPLLSNVHFKYDSEVKEVSKLDFPILFRGSELVAVGKYEGAFAGTVEGEGINGSVAVKSRIAVPVSSIERLWAYLTIKQKLEEREKVENKTQLTHEALQLALRYSFVTDVSSLVVVKPNETSSVNTVDASNDISTHSSVVGLRFSDDMDMGYNALDGDDDGDLFMDSFSTPSAYDGDDRLLASNVIIADFVNDMLPWLKNVSNPNKTLTIGGRAYDLGLDADHIPPVECPMTPFNNTKTGECVLLTECVQVFSLLKDFQEYQKYFCPLDNNKYAGICCAKEDLP